jgi:hypothetical protein
MWLEFVFVVEFVFTIWDDFAECEVRMKLGLSMRNRCMQSNVQVNGS